MARSIHNFRLLMEALGGKDKQLSQLVDASNAVFATFAKEEANFQKTLALLPGALHKTGVGLGKLAHGHARAGPDAARAASRSRARSARPTKRRASSR